MNFFLFVAAKKGLDLSQLEHFLMDSMKKRGPFDFFIAVQIWTMIQKWDTKSIINATKFPNSGIRKKYELFYHKLNKLLWCSFYFQEWMKHIICINFRKPFIGDQNMSFNIYVRKLIFAKCPLLAFLQTTILSP